MRSDSVMDDPRPIASVEFNDDTGARYAVGCAGVTKIDVYGEYGEYGFLPTLRVWQGDHLLSRIPARMVEVIYAAPEVK